jgi:hypothetical protein
VALHPRGPSSVNEACCRRGVSIASDDDGSDDDDDGFLEEKR